jgi:hypothetical protein
MLFIFSAVSFDNLFATIAICSHTFSRFAYMFYQDGLCISQSLSTQLISLSTVSNDIH